jgi:hypothetical protein
MGTNITGIGNANAIGFKSRVTGGAYFPPELKDALVGVWSAYGKSNDSTDRNIIKNKIKDRGGDFVISNAAFKLNSGFGGFVEDFTSWDRIDSSTAEISNDGSKIKCINTTLNVQYLFNSINRDIPSFKVKISNFTKGDITYYYRKEDGIEAFLKINPLSVVNSDKVIELPKSYNTVENGTGGRGGFYSSNINIGVTITQIPSFEGAFVTDGIDDLITSTKTVQEMLGGSNEITVVSMMANLDSRKILCNSNYSNTNGYNVRNTLEPNGVITMLGYTDKNGTTNNLNLIMGDKDSIKLVDKVNFNSDYVFYPAQYYKAYYQVAWYWTFIANRVLTEDEINLVIEKYNLDRPGEIVKPDVYYDIKRQKITNENHSAFDDKLIDYSGNGYDAKLYNFGWKEDSGIGKYETDFTDWKKSFKVTSFDSESIKFTSDVSWVLLYHPSSIGEDIPSFKVRIKLYGKGTLYYNYITQEGKYTNVAVKSEIFETPICYNTKYTGEKGVNVGFTLGVISGECSGTITQIPEYKDALIFDGIDDYGKVTGLPILKDYTVAADYIRTFAKENAQDSPILSKSKVAGSGAFLFNYLNADSVTSSYSFGTNNILKEINDSERKIYYLSKYASDGHNVNAGSAVDYDTMWLGTYRDNISNFFTGALYFAMLFPYSLSEFLLERQIKKARAGTLYPNQVEFRPVIPEDENITRIDYFVVDSGIWKVIKPGDYVDVGARIVLNVYTKLPYKIAGASSTAFTGMSVRHSTELNIFDVEGYIKDKTPQKIKLTLAVNEDIVQWNPAITSNLLDSFTASSWYLNGWDNTLTVGTWIKKTDRVFFKATFKTELYGLETATFGGTECVVSKANNWSDSKNIWDIRMLGTVGDLSQIFNLDVYELIRFEDIVQPYPALLRFKDENGNEVSWGGKFKVGSTITRIGSAADSNLLPNIYNIFGLLLNGNQVTSSKVIVEKTMVFKVKSAYIFDNNEPKCILSPRLLRIPNSSYKILGHIPDISGHGNNGKINNSAYEGMSGVNGYPVVFGKNKTWANESNGYVTNITSNTIHITNVLNAGLALLYSYVKYNGNLQNIKEIPPFKIEIKGLEGRSKFIYKYLATSDATKETNLYLGNGTHELPKSFLPTEALINNAVVGFSISPIEEGVTNFLSDITIKVLPEYEGAYCLDGVDDFVTIPTATGGKQVFMKVNSRKSDCYLYDQRNNWTQYLGIVSTKDFIAYNYSNQRGKTYIDGILNENITANDLIDITHNITVTNNRDDVKQYSPCIGTSFARNSFAQMALYEFMLFDEVSTNEEIKQLNDIVGIEGGYVQKPPYYWDAYGKTNLDADKATIQQRGVAVGNYDLTNYNHAYDKMSGYGGYSLGRFDKSWSSSNNTSVIVVSRNPYDITLKKLGGNSDWEFNNTELKVISNPVSVKFKSNKNIRVTCDYHYYPVGGNSEGTPLGITSKDLIANKDAIITISPISQENIDKYNIDVNRGYYLIYFQLSSTLAVNEEVTIEMLPLYPNGLVYDGVDDYSENASIPLLSDYTYIFKRTLLNKKYNSASIFKGSNKQSGGGAFICDYNSVEPDLLTQGFSFGAGLYVDSLNADSIVYGTRGSVNGTKITAGNNTDTEGLTVGKWRAYKEMVFYKLFLYPRTVNMLSINMVKNMMEEDGIIDLTSKLFTDKYTGDFYEMDFNNDFLIGN